MPYIANTAQDQKDMLSAIRCASFDELWTKLGITDPKPSLDKTPSGRSEFEVYGKLKRLAQKNAYDLVNFVGGGYYDHLIPAVVDELSSRSEFYTAYTPYQAEASQGTLQAIYEYQSMICRLTGMDISNASLYDGGTALFEAMMMAVRISGKRRAVISEAVSPIFRTMIRCYCANLDVELAEVAAGVDDSAMAKLLNSVDDNTACVIVQYPNFFGRIEDWSVFTKALQDKKVISIASSYPTALALITPPGELGFDIVTGEGQSLGIPLSFGGPYLGFMAVREKYMRKMPGRVVGRAKDHDGRDGFVLTLQAREQHIKRENATSNICSNESLCALRSLIYLSALGKEGFVEVANLCAANAVYTRNELLKIKHVEPVGGEAFFNEFVIKLPMDASLAAGHMIDRGFAVGFPLGRYYPDRKNELLIAVTEKRTPEEIKSMVAALEAVLWN